MDKTAKMMAHLFAKQTPGNLIGRLFPEISTTKLAEALSPLTSVGEVVENAFPGITGDVDQYLRETPFCGRPMFREGLDYFEVTDCHLYGQMSVVPKGLDEEDLSNSERDLEFSGGLHEIGAKYGILLSLPSWAYEK